MQLNFRTFGQGEPLIVLHGLFGTLDNWLTLGKALAEHFMVFLVDQRNHGRSPHAPEFDYPTLAEDLRAFMEDNWIYSAHLLGHSMGGKTAMQFALMYPDLVKRLVVVDIAPRDYEGGHEEIFEALLELDLDELPSRKEAEIQLAYRIHDPGTRQFILKNLHINTATGKYEWKMNLPTLWTHYRDILRNVDTRGFQPFNGPTLFVKGAQSNYILPHHLPLIQQLFPQSELATIEQAGHWVHADQPTALLQVVQQFLLRP